MALISNVPQIQFTNNGVIVPSDQAILTGELQDIDSAFGGGLSLDLTTPQGQLATSISASISEKDAEILYISNQVDPQYAQGFFQDAIGNIYFIIRKPGTFTTVTVQVIGLPGTVIPAGTLEQDTAGNFYSCIADITINNFSMGTGTFQNINVGNIPCPANTLTIIYQSIPGLDAINNSAAGIPGSPIEDRAQFEFRRQQSVELNAQGSIPAIRGAVFALPGVLDCYAIDNPTGSPITIGTVTLIAHSIFICVYSNQWTLALQQAVANTILTKKNPGSAYNGNTTITAYDGTIPYDVTFQTAIVVQIYFTVNIVNNPALPSNIINLIQIAIENAFDQHIGDLISANNYYGTILSVYPGIQIISVFVGNVISPVTTSFQMQITEQPLLMQSNVTVNLV